MLYDDKIHFINELLNKIQFIKSGMSNIELLNYIVKELNKINFTISKLQDGYNTFIKRTSLGLYVGPLTTEVHNLYTIYKDLQCSIKQQS